METDIRNLVPKSKFDNSHIEILKTIDKEKVEPILGELLVWLQDINWPIAQALIEVLPRFQEELIPHVVKVFQSNDDIWKNWTLCLIEDFSRDTVLSLLTEINRMVNHPTKGEVAEETPNYANRVLKKFCL